MSRCYEPSLRGSSGSRSATSKESSFSLLEMPGREGSGSGYLSCSLRWHHGSFWPLSFNDHFNFPYSVMSHMLYDCKWHLYKAESVLYFTLINLLWEIMTLTLVCILALSSNWVFWARIRSAATSATSPLCLYPQTKCSKMALNSITTEKTDSERLIDFWTWVGPLRMFNSLKYNKNFPPPKLFLESSS